MQTDKESSGKTELLEDQVRKYYRNSFTVIRPYLVIKDSKGKDDFQ